MEAEAMGLIMENGEKEEDLKVKLLSPAPLCCSQRGFQNALLFCLRMSWREMSLWIRRENVG